MIITRVMGVLGLVVSGVMGLATHGNFETEQGSLRLAWSLEEEAVTFTLQANASSYVAVGFGTGMTNLDVVLCWIENGAAHAVDSWSVGHSLPKPDESFGGTNDVETISGSTEGNVMSISFKRLLNTSDSFDTVLPAALPFSVVFAWSDGEPGNIAYHMKQHGHWQLDLSKSNGVPDNTFGAEMTGVGARYLISNMTVGALATLNIVDGAGAADTEGFPHPSVTSFADFGDGRPIILLSELERNIINQNIDARCALEVHDVDMIAQGVEPMMVPRTTVYGHLQPVPQNSSVHDIARTKYLSAHPTSSMWIDFGDFHLYFLEPKDVYWVGGFGGPHYIGWISPVDYMKSVPRLWGTEFVWKASYPEPELEDLMV